MIDHTNIAPNKSCLLFKSIDEALCACVLLILEGKMDDALLPETMRKLCEEAITWLAATIHK